MSAALMYRADLQMCGSVSSAVRLGRSLCCILHKPLCLLTIGVKSSGKQHQAEKTPQPHLAQKRPLLFEPSHQSAGATLILRALHWCWHHTTQKFRLQVLQGIRIAV